MTEPWTYYSFYFGNANSPSGMFWRVSGDRREVEVEYGLYLGSVTEARRTYETARERKPLVETFEPQYCEESEGRFLVKWWALLPPDKEKAEWDFCTRSGTGDAVSEQTMKHLHMIREYKPLY